MGRFKKVRFKRRRKNKTDYKAREALLRANKPKFVIRKTNLYIIAQIVKSKEAQDSTLIYANSKELKRFGWVGSFKNIAASYLTGYFIGLKAKKQGINKVIVDLGLYRSTKGSRCYAVIKGAIDSGLEIPCKPEMLPKKERIESKNIAEILNRIKEELE